MHSVTTDYVNGTGNPAPYLRRIAEAGFSHVHWCHQWNTDYLYTDVEIDQIGKWLKEYGLQLNDLHASEGQVTSWVSPLEHLRLAGVELVKNRIKMTARLGSDVIIMHVGAEPKQAAANKRFWTRLQKSLDELEPYARTHGIRIAIESLIVDNFDTIEKIFARYRPDYIGLCYDSGHANIGGDRMGRLQPLKDRLISLHLHDNDGSGDQHKLPYTGTVNWPRLAGIIAQSAYVKCISLEVTIQNTGIEDESVFLKKAFEAASRISDMVEAHRRDRQAHDLEKGGVPIPD